MFLVHTLTQQIWTVCMLGVTGLSVWRGGWAERTIAVGMVVASVASALVENRHDWSATQWGILTVDVIYLALIFWVALRSEPLWPLFPAAFQLITVVLYAARMADWHVGARAPIVAEHIFSYLILLAIAVGVLLRKSGHSNHLLPPSTSTGTSAT